MKNSIIRLLKKCLRLLDENKHDSPLPLRRESYEKKYAVTLREWLIHHQKEIVFDRMTWMGIKIWKNPLDTWIYQEIIYEVKPDIIVEIGSRYGGSTKFFADLLQIMGNGTVISIDPHRDDYTLEHERVISLTGKSSDPDILSKVAELCRDKKVFVIQDGDHSKAQALEDLENYSGFVSIDSYFIMEDGIVDLFHEGDGLGFKEKEPGPLAATEAFLEKNPRFISDIDRERYILTYNPKGFLKRIA